MQTTSEWSTSIVADIRGVVRGEVIGREDAGALVYRNLGSRTEARFELDSTLVVPLHHLGTPAFGDLDGDGELRHRTHTGDGGVGVGVDHHDELRPPRPGLAAGSVDQ